MRRALLLVTAALAVAGFFAGHVSASGKLQLGLFVDPQVLGRPDQTFPLLTQLRVQVIRVTLHWGGPIGVARAKPAVATDPSDPAYNWFPYDRAVRDAHAAGIKVMFSIVDTPRWANGSKLNRVPKKMSDLRNFAYAAAKRYSGSYVPGLGDPAYLAGDDPAGPGKALPPVRLWLAWNEANNPVFLGPQYVRKGKKWVVNSPVLYAKICSAIFTGVHLTTLSGQKVACGATAPRGNNNPKSIRPSIGPIPFLRGLKKAGLKRFDVYAHHPYYGQRTETPATKPKTNRGKKGLIAPPVLLGNIGDLVKELTRLYGSKRVWITEYGYQTSPPDRAFGVTYAKQAAYLKQAVRIARQNPRIDMLVWFLLRDEARLSGWQSGLMTATMVRKPSFAAFRSARG
ncbi:MAG: glycosyl hydrolase [Gaiellaceae bacterium]